MGEKSEYAPYVSKKVVDIVTCATCGYLYKNDEKYCHGCGDDEVHIDRTIFIRPHVAVENIKFNVVISKENGICTLVSKE